MAHTPKAPIDLVRAANCPRKITLLADGGVRVVWACGAVRESGRDSGEWPAVDLRVLDENIDRHHVHRHHPHVPHRAKTATQR